MTWMVSRGGKVRGPFTEPEMFELFGRGKVGAGDLLSRDGGLQWLPIERSELFASAFLQVAPASTHVQPQWPQQTPTLGTAWYHSTPFAVLSLFFCWPIGLVLLWTNRRASVVLKWVVTGALAAMCVAGVAIVSVAASRVGAAVSSKPASGAMEAAATAVAPDDPGQVAMDVELYHLLGEYKRNEISADEEFKGRRVRTTGSILRVAKDMSDRPYLTVGNGSQFEIPVAQCFLSDSRSAVSLSPGQRVTISGKVTGKLVNVLLENCEFE